MLTWIVSPLSNIYSPLQGTARLYAYIKKNGFNVKLRDFNQDAFFTLLSKAYLEQCFDKLNGIQFSILRSHYLQDHYNALLLNGSRFFLNELIHFGQIDINRSTRYHAYDSSNLFFKLLENKETVLDKIIKASILLNKHFFNLESTLFLNSYATILCGKSLYDAVYFPNFLDFGFGFHSTKYGMNATDISTVVQNHHDNFLLPYFLTDVIPLVDKEQPEVIGISVTHSSEIIPALTLGNLVKRRFPCIHICLGGAVVTEIAYRIKKNPCLWDFFDSIVLGPGEESFSRLLDCVQTKKSLNKVPNLIYKHHGAVIESPLKHEFDLNNACCPEYPTLRPKNPLVLETASGCYWGKCIFCYYPRLGKNLAESNFYRERNIDLVYDDIKELKKKYDPLYIGITDSSLHPQRLTSILEFNKKYNLSLHFTAFLRFEKELLSVKFCRKLADNGFLGSQMGLESGSQRVNDIIIKGVQVSDAKRILMNLFETGILVHLYSIIGTPGEEKHDAEQTFLFLKKMHKFLTLDWQIYSFTLLENGPIAKQMNNFNLEMHPLPDTNLMQFVPYRNKNGLSMQESFQLSNSYYEKLKRYLHPFSKIMDVESYKQVIFVQKAVNQLKINKSHIRKKRLF
jgi:anaerobic magnesium-protoporphyrin IX monomethyl ester cyclase